MNIAISVSVSINRSIDVYTCSIVSTVSSGVSNSQLCYRRVSRDQRSSIFLCVFRFKVRCHCTFSNELDFCIVQCHTSLPPPPPPISFCLSLSLSLSTLSPDSDRPITHIPAPRSMSHSGPDHHTSRGGGGAASVTIGRSHHSAFIEDFNALQIQESKSKSSTLPGNHTREPPSVSHLAPSYNLPGFPYCPPSPEPPGKKASQKRSLFRRRAESVDNHRVKT